MSRLRLIEHGLDELSSAVAAAKTSVDLAAPFLSRSVAGLILDRSPRAVGRRLLTAVTERSVRGGFLSARGLAALLDGGFEVRSIPNLHAKAAIVDGRWAMIGSGNLTAAGLAGGNLELGVAVNAQDAISASRVFDGWWDRASEVELTELEEFMEMEPPDPRARQRGRSIGSPVRVGSGSALRKHLAAGGKPGSSSGTWLKMLHHHPERDRESWWASVTWISDAHAKDERGAPLLAASGEPGRKPTYAVGDLLVLYLAQSGRCPAIVRVEDLPEFNPAYVNEFGYEGDGDRWGWLTRVEVVATAPLSRAPTLAHIDVASASVRQQSRIRLTDAQYELARAALQRA